MTTAGDALTVMRSLLGSKERPDGSNHAEPVTTWYGLVGAWCGMTVSYALAHAGLGGVRFAWTPSGRAGFQNGTLGSWHTTPEPGDLVFYSFGGKRTDHVGMVESVPGDGTVVTLEGNVGNACKRLVRRLSMPSLQGFGRPRYSAATAPKAGLPTATGGNRTLALGSRGADVKAWQVLLQGAGHLPKTKGTADGVFGPVTRRATVKLQGQLHVQADGIVGPATRAAADALLRYLAGLTRAQVKAAARPATGPVLKRGARGEPVRRLQRRLAHHGHMVAADGQFGPRTLAAVKSFQKGHQLTADGIVGAKTWRALG